MRSEDRARRTVSPAGDSDGDDKGMDAVRSRLGKTNIEIFQLCLGGNVFGGNAGTASSMAVLDAYVDAGGNFVDTADLYGDGASEEVLGKWLVARRNRADIILATKVGKAATLRGLRRETIRAALDNSLRRLQTDYVDLYYAHSDDPETPIEETLSAFAEVISEGKVRHIAASNFEPARLAESLAVAKRAGLPRYVALQTRYNLVERREYETGLRAVCADEGLPCLPYFSLASGFLTGKYRPGRSPNFSGRRVLDTRRTERARAHLTARGLAVLGVVDEVAYAHRTSAGAVALAWLLAQPTVTSPIASARTPTQLAEIISMVSLDLSQDERDALTRVSSVVGTGRQMEGRM